MNHPFLAAPLLALATAALPAAAQDDDGRASTATLQGTWLVTRHGYNSGGGVDGATDIRARVTLGEDGQTFTYTAALRFLDSGGGLQFEACGKAEGTRLPSP
jgi:hypothetical protein